MARSNSGVAKRASGVGRPSGFKLPEGAVPVPGNVLAEGEVTGHAHRVKGRDAVVYDQGDVRLLHAPEGAEVVHEEHGPLGVPANPKGYLIGKVKEYDHLKEESRAVRD